MRGKRFHYRNNNIQFENLQVRGSIYVFEFSHLNGGPLVIEKDEDKVDLFLDCLVEIKPSEAENNIAEKTSAAVVTETLPVKQNWEPALLRENRALLTSLRDMLMDDMKMCRKDKTYIPQAKQACNTANSIINLAKLEIMMLRSE